MKCNTSYSHVFRPQPVSFPYIADTKKVPKDSSAQDWYATSIQAFVTHTITTTTTHKQQDHHTMQVTLQNLTIPLSYTLTQSPDFHYMYTTETSCTHTSTHTHVCIPPQSHSASCKVHQCVCAIQYECSFDRNTPLVQVAGNDYHKCKSSQLMAEKTPPAQVDGDDHHECKVIQLMTGKKYAACTRAQTITRACPSVSCIWWLHPALTRAQDGLNCQQLALMIFICHHLAQIFTCNCGGHHRQLALVFSSVLTGPFYVIMCTNTLVCFATCTIFDTYNLQLLHTKTTLIYIPADDS